MNRHKQDRIILLVVASFVLLAMNTLKNEDIESKNNEIVNNNFSGDWNWDRNSETSTFNLSLSQINNNITGSHCAIAMNGKRVDCSEEDEFSINGTITDGVALVAYKSSYSPTLGQAKLTILSNGNLKWEIINKASGQAYLPIEAILIRQ